MAGKKWRNSRSSRSECSNALEFTFITSVVIQSRFAGSVHLLCRVFTTSRLRRAQMLQTFLSNRSFGFCMQSTHYQRTKSGVYTIQPLPSSPQLDLCLIAPSRVYHRHWYLYPSIQLLCASSSNGIWSSLSTFFLQISFPVVLQSP